ncbi:hypothetical protein KC347_g108 [Hortaea werneckii]|nr:hypothetical protein KC347_g108 [Hortaea werneckii]
MAIVIYARLEVDHFEHHLSFVANVGSQGHVQAMLPVPVTQVSHKAMPISRMYEPLALAWELPGKLPSVKLRRLRLIGRESSMVEHRSKGRSSHTFSCTDGPTSTSSGVLASRPRKVHSASSPTIGRKRVGRFAIESACFDLDIIASFFAFSGFHWSYKIQQHVFASGLLVYFESILNLSVVHSAFHPIIFEFLSPQFLCMRFGCNRRLNFAGSRDQMLHHLQSRDVGPNAVPFQFL